MIPEVYKPFIKILIDKTNNEEALWEASSRKAFILKTTNATIEIGQYIDDDAELKYYYFNYSNFNTKKDSHFRVSNMENSYSTMEELFYVASASASNIKDELNSFLDDLN